MRIAVITGASSGMGREFAKAIGARQGLDEIWVIARRRDRLEELQREIPIPLRILALDLSDGESLHTYDRALQEAQPQVEVLVNCSGFGKFGRYDDIPLEDALGMIDVNVKALVAMTQLTLPYMERGGQIYQIDSLSSFQPVPYLNVYGATKAFVLSYSRALNVELRGRGIRCMAVCPGWVRTEFFQRATQTNDHAVTYFNIFYQPQDIVKTALKHMAKGKDVSVHGLPVKAQVLLVKLMPHRFVMWVWMKQQKLQNKS
nr:SDR family oxidoreductase [bacterium]